MTKTLTHEELSHDAAAGEPGRTDHPRRIVALLVAGAMAAGVVVAANVDGTASDRAPARTQNSQEVFPGCLNDVECYGEPSGLPPR